MKNRLIFLCFMVLAPFLGYSQITAAETQVHTPGITPDGFCFSMSFEYVPGTRNYCIEYSIQIHGHIGDGNEVVWYDAKGNSHSCASDCRFVICYDVPSPGLMNFWCHTKDDPNNTKSCYKAEGCDVIVGGGY